MLEITPDITIPDDELDESFIQASGPGGQNVNKVATAVQLRFDAARSRALTPAVRERLLRIAGAKATAGGALLITARRFRTQEANRRDARSRLAALVAKAAQEPRPRRPTRATRAARERRLQAKAQRGAIKRQRAERPDDDE